MMPEPSTGPTTSTPPEDAGAIPPGNLTFMFTDIEGSTRRWEADADAIAADDHALV